MAALAFTVTRRHCRSTSVPGAAEGDDGARAFSLSTMFGSRGTDGGWLVDSNSDGVHGQHKERRGRLRRLKCSVACHCRRPRTQVDNENWSP